MNLTVRSRFGRPRHERAAPRTGARLTMRPNNHHSRRANWLAVLDTGQGVVLDNNSSLTADILARYDRNPRLISSAVLIGLILSLFATVPSGDNDREATVTKIHTAIATNSLAIK